MKIEVKVADDSENALSVAVFRVGDGGDHDTITVQPGETADLELNQNYHARFSPGARTAPDEPVDQAPAHASVRSADAAEEPELRDGTDDEIRTVLNRLEADATTERTNAGNVKLGAVNKALADEGLNKIDDNRRKDLLAPAQ